MWDAIRWPNFSEKELACPCCGLFIKDENALDCLQKLRTLLGKPVIVNSGTRCAKHNKAEGGAPRSEHLRGKAFDIAIGAHETKNLYWTAQVAGFKGFGFGRTFLHCDVGRTRFWDYGQASRAVWKGIMP